MPKKHRPGLLIILCIGIGNVEMSPQLHNKECILIEMLCKVMSEKVHIYG